MSKHKISLAVLGAASLSASILGWVIYFLKGDVSEISWAFVWLGIFTWDDGMILGLFIFIACIVLWRKRKPALSGLFFSAYALLRSLIEIFYGLNAQFSPITRPWESALPVVANRVHLRLPELFVIYQIFFTAICVISLVVFLAYLRRYLRATR